MIWLYVALNRTPDIDCYWGGGVPNLNPTLRPGADQEAAKPVIHSTGFRVHGHLEASENSGGFRDPRI